MINGGSNPLLLASVNRTRIVWAGGWRCGDSSYPVYELSGTFTDGAAIATTDEILYAIGTNLNTQIWVNPHTAGRVAIVRSIVGTGTDAEVCDRAASFNRTTNVAGSWYCIDFGADSSGRQILPSKFRFQHGYPSSEYRCLALIVEGSNNAASNSVGDLTAASWSAIATHSSLGLAAVAYSWSAELPLPGSTWYRRIRFRMTATNSSGTNNLIMGEIAIGGQIRYV